MFRPAFAIFPSSGPFYLDCAACLKLTYHLICFAFEEVWSPKNDVGTQIGSQSLFPTV